MTSPWADVAAAGTDPQRLARAVAWQLRAGPERLRARLQRVAAERPTAAPEELVAALLAAPGAPALAAAAGAASVWAELGVRVALAGDPEYPRRLTAGWPDTGGPLWLARRGAVGLLDRPAVAIVGSRRATPYGTGVAAWLAEAAVAAGAVVVSGGARGIDAAAHRASLRATVVVLGCGHDVPYPRPHARRGGLFDEIRAAGGTIVSESLPGESPRPLRVRARNRIVAGLADAVVVVEGREGSGTLRTAADAAELGVPVLAVPGDVRAPDSAAPHLLLAEGAAPCTGPADVLAALDLRPLAASRRHDAGADATSVLPEAIYHELARRWPRPVDLAELAASSGLPAGQLLAALTRSRLAGEVVDDPAGIRLRRAP